MQQKEIKYQERRIFYRTSGEGIPLVLVHGFGEDGTIWKNQFDAFPGCHLIVPDLPGSGGSEAIDDMSMEGMAAVLEKIIVHETATVFYKKGEPGSVIMIGHSMGGYITLAFARQHQEMLLGFGLFHSTAFADNDQKKETRKKAIDFTRKHGAFEFLKTSVPGLYSADTRQKHAGKILHHLDGLRNFSADVLVSYYEAMMQRADNTDVLRETRLPVLFLLGKYDTAVTLEDGLQQVHLPQLSYVHVFQNSGHMGMIEEPGDANHHLSKYLELVKSHLT